MKARQDFVSNSSSSSFIISKTEIFTHFKIGKADIEEALASLWIDGKVDLDSKDELSRPFVVYEMPKDRAKAVRAFGQMLEFWNQEFPSMDDAWDPAKEQAQAFKSLLRSLEAVDHSWYLSNGDEDSLAHSDAPEHIKETIREARRKLEIKKADEVLLDNDTHLFIHFGENDIMSIDGIDEDGQKDSQDGKQGKDVRFESPAYSCARFIEILFARLVELKKIDPIDPKLLEKYPLDEDSKKRMPNRVSWLNGDIYTWKDFLDEGVVHCVFHEG